MSRSYHHLSPEERGVIMAEQQRGSSNAAIARMLGRSPSTLSRELRRNGGGAYSAPLAGNGYRLRRVSSRRPHRLVEGTALHRFVVNHLLFLQWSPEQIAATLRVMHADDPTARVSHETIYAAIYAHPKGALREGMIAALRQAKPSRGLARRTLAGAGGLRIPEGSGIKHRPEEIARRLVPGHWEGDLIKGAFNRSAIATLVERKTRFVVLCKMVNCSADAALDSLVRQMKKLPAFLRESLTYDRGSEMARHAELAQRLNITIWFADPYAPWQRGSNENTNGLLRQYFPKGADLSGISQTTLNDVARLLNGRPRKTLGWKTPEQAMAAEIEQFRQRVALDS